MCLSTEIYRKKIQFKIAGMDALENFFLCRESNPGRPVHGCSCVYRLFQIEDAMRQLCLSIGLCSGDDEEMGCASVFVRLSVFLIVRQAMRER
jgi:hypothetical protein